MSGVYQALTNLGRYAGREGQWSFILHRLTGLGTLLFLTIHILDTSTVYFFPELYEHAIEIYRLPLFMVGEIFLVFAVIFHGVNGLRIAVFDLFAPGGWATNIQRHAALWTMAASLVLWLPAAFWMARSMLIHSFGVTWLGG